MHSKLKRQGDVLTSVWCAALLSMPLAVCAPRTDAPPAAGGSQGSSEAGAADDGTAQFSAGGYAKQLRRAASMLRIGQGARALRLVQQAIEGSPTKPAGYGLLGQLLAGADQLPKSIIAYERAIELGSTRRSVFMELASVYDVSKRYVDAERIFSLFLGQQPDDVEVQHQLGLTLLLLKRYGKGEAALRRALALRQASSAVRESPRAADILVDIGYGQKLAGQVNAARDTWLTVVRQEGEHSLALEFLGQAAAGQGDVGQAKGYLDRAIAATPERPSPRRLRARLARVVGDLPVALADYDWLLKRQAKDAGALLGRAAVYVAQAKLMAARRDVEAARVLVGVHPQVDYRTAQVDWRLALTSTPADTSAIEAAVSVLRSLAARRNSASEAWRELLLVAQATGNKTLAREARNQLRKLGAR